MRCPIPGPATLRSRPIPGAARSPAIPRPAGPARRTAQRRRPTQVDAFFGGAGDWSYRRMVRHYAQLAAQRRRRRCVPDRLGVAEPDARALRAPASIRRWRSSWRSRPRSKAILGSGTPVTYGADWTEYGAHVVDAEAQRGALSARSAVGVARISTRSASTITRRCRTGATARAHLDRALSSSIHDRDYLAAQSRERRGLRLVLCRCRGARGADPHADHRRARQALDVPAEGHLELLVERASRARRRRRA